MSVVIAADTGGTFTDLVAWSADDAKLSATKAMTTYDALTRGLMSCVRQVKVDLGEASAFKFGTTLVINALLQRKGARTALICTRGFRDTIEIRRGNRVSPFDVRYQQDPVLVPRELRFEIDERVDSRGSVVRPLNDDNIRILIEKLRAAEPDAIAVSFVNAYRNASHERIVTTKLREAFPGLYVTAGSEISREWYEYERASTAAANGFVGPPLADFLDAMQTTLKDAGFKRNLYVMASNGGVLSLEEARRQPIQLVESGPVGGCIGAAAYARALGLDRVIAFDMGGTTAKCALIAHGAFEVRSPYYVGGVEHGFPIRGAVLDILEVGAGGGSIAAVDGQKRLAVGPGSAGSTPGPACYGRGGDKATVTDANVLLGRIGAATFLDGSIRLDASRSEAVIMREVGAPLDYDTTQIDHVAQGIIDVATLTMASAIAKISTEKGLDPRDFSLFVFGGGGPLHGVDLARHIGIPRVIVPPRPGMFSALGMLMASARIDESRTYVARLDAASLQNARAMWAEMRQLATERLPREALDAPGLLTVRWADLRFVGQRHSMRTMLAGADTIESIREPFIAAYRERFGHANPEAPLEFVALGVSVEGAVGEVTPTALAPRQRGMGSSSPPRSIYFKQCLARIETPVMPRESLSIDDVRTGPLAVEEYGSSTVLAPGDRLTVGRLGELVIEVRP